MKLSPLRFLALALLLVASLHAGSRETAFQARALLGPDVWSRVLRIVNQPPPGQDSRYPAEFHGLVVACEGILWLYTEFDGTQSLSLYRGRLAADQANLGPLLQAVEPGLVAFQDVTDRPPKHLPRGKLPASCFLASVARWQQLQREPAPPTRARLLAIYAAGHPRGHMVLEYWRGSRRYVFDPDKPAVERQLSAGLAEDPLEVARVLLVPGERYRPVRALHVDLRVVDRSLVASLPVLSPPGKAL